MTPPQAYLRCKQRWPHKDGYAWDIMRKDPRTALLFAQKIIGGRFPDGEKAIAQDSESSLEYALLIKKRFPQGEPSIASNPNHAIEYAEKVLKGPFPACEPALSCNPASACAYATRILRRPYPPEKQPYTKAGSQRPYTWMRAASGSAKVTWTLSSI